MSPSEQAESVEIKALGGVNAQALNIVTKNELIIYLSEMIRT
jgi:hypothetical protein